MIRVNNKIKSKHRQSGLSLIELMISMVVGLFLLVGLVTSFIGTKDNDRTRNAVSEMDANANVIFDVMRKTIAHAGYVSINPVIRPTPGFYTENDTITPRTCRNGSQRDLPGMRMDPTSDNPTGDTITLVSLADNPCRAGLNSCPNEADINPNALVYYDCTGGGITAAQDRDADSVACSTDADLGMTDGIEAKIYSSFRLLLNNNGTDDRTLFCDGNRGGSLAIASDVEAVQYLYGVREANNTTTFKDADTVEADNDWEKVRSVQVALLMRSSEQFILKQNSNKTAYSLLDTTVNISAADRKRLFRVYTNTINLENMK